jgi:uncharacterized protein YfaS (alpha-2-macroglobulin family)
VAEPLRHLAVQCGIWSEDDEVCRFDSGRLRTSGTRVYLRFNNPIATKQRRLPQHVAITPRVRNLSLGTINWDDGWLVARGDFRPSTTYRMRVAGLTDRYGSRLPRPIDVAIDVLPLGASVTMPEGLLLLDAETSRRFPVHSRNVAQAELLLWPVRRDDGAAFRRALDQSRSRDLGEGAPLRIDLPIRASRDRLVETSVDLTKHLAEHASYLATVRPVARAFGAEPMRFPRGSEASRSPVALLRVGAADSLAVHTHQVPGSILVHVARLGTGEPVPQAAVSLLGDPQAAPVETDGSGVALLRTTDRSNDDRLLRVAGPGEPLLVPITSGRTEAQELFPELAAGSTPGHPTRRAMLLTDRGIYRPGATLHVKASLFRAEGTGLEPHVAQLLRLKLLGPAGDVVADRALLSGPLGGAALDLAIPADAKLGRHRLVLEDFNRADVPLARASVVVAAFEPPRFAVDVMADPAADAGELGATVRGRYLFGAPMEGADLEWSIRRRAASVPPGPLSRAGLSFRGTPRWHEPSRSETTWSRTGQGTLGADGTFRLDQPVPIAADGGPQLFEIEADVSDSSFRHVVGKARWVKHPADRYAGIKGPRGWVGVGKPIEVELGAVDTQGRAVAGATVTARLFRLEWRLTQQRVEGGALRRRWTTVRTEAGRCVVRTEGRTVSCTLPVRRSGDYEVAAEVDGRTGGAISFWAWREGEPQTAPAPSRGAVMDISTDQAAYAPGDTARLLVRSPYPRATAIVTTEAGRLLRYHTARIEGAAGVLEVPIRAGYAPHVNATVTLLPIGAGGAEQLGHRIGAVRLPVTRAHAGLDVKVATGRQSYQPGEEAVVTVSVLRDGQPKPGAEVTVAVVDEGVLRLTGYRAVDPARALHPGWPLDFRLTDTRQGLMELGELSHVAGDGGSGEAGHGAAARSRFVKTAAWQPMLITDDAGSAELRVQLPDNLTEFRVVAVAVDEQGRGGATERGFTVHKPVMLTAELPRFAAVGDRFDAAAMVHNQTKVAFHGLVRFGEREQPLSLAPGARQRVAFEVVADRPGPIDLALSVADDGGVRDSVIRRIAVHQPGVERRPRLHGAFQGEEQIDLKLPGDLVAGEQDALIVKVGQHLWPELGARLEYLLDYPHGCVEQTTSSTLPLIAARDILPRIGLSRVSDEFLNVRIRAGLDRLASMRTRSGGLGYWPGATEPNVYGTAYAMRAVVLAEQLGVSLPAELKSGMVRFLGKQLRDESVEPEVRAAIAQSLAEVGELDPGAADALFDAVAEASVFGQASLALALDRLSGHRDRIDRLLDRVELAFSEQGELLRQPGRDDFHYFGSPTRTKAQAAMALGRLRPSSRRAATLVSDLAEAAPAAYSTQATAYSLLALGDYLRQSGTDGAAVRVELDGERLEPHERIGSGGWAYRVSLGSLRGKARQLTLRADGRRTIAYQVEARYGVPARSEAASTVAETSGRRGPDLYRLYTDPRGGPVDPASIKAGSVVRVSLLARLPADLPRRRRGYLAITDRLPAGFEPIDPDLATVASAPDIADHHPFAELLRWSRERADHVELGDDRVKIYFDRPYGDELCATYLARATTVGAFEAPPAVAELMYEPASSSYSSSTRVVIR